MNLLIVDDEKMVLEVLEDGLQCRGYQVLKALNAQEALKCINDAGNKIDLAIVDYRMPGMNGLELLKAIRENDSSMPVIMMTAYAEKGLIIDALHGGCDGFVEKPFTFDKLSEEIRTVKVNRAIKSLKDRTGRNHVIELEETDFRSYVTYLEGKLLASGLDLKKLTDMCTDMFVELMRVDLGYLMLFSEKSGELSIEAVKGLKQEQVKKEDTLKITKDVVEWIVECKKPVLLSELDDLRIKGFFSRTSKKVGAETTLSIPLVVKNKFIGLVNLGGKESKEQFSPKDFQMLSGWSSNFAVAISNAQLHEGLLKSYFGAVSALAEAIETKDPYTRGHSDRVSRYASAMAQAMNLPESEIDGIRVAGILHDVGKIGVPEGLLLKFSPLSEAEFEVIKEHSVISDKIIEKAVFPWDVRPLARHHHERYDGGGYPDGLRGKDIPLGARILAVADTYEALLADRPYRAGFPKEKALEIIKEVAGTQLDPGIVSVFLDLVEKGEIE